MKQKLRNCDHTLKLNKESKSNEHDIPIEIKSIVC